MNKSKRGLVLGSFLGLFLHSLSFLGAYTGDVSQGPNDLIYMVVNFLGPFFEAILGVSQFDQNFFARVLLLIIVFVITSIALEAIDTFKGKKGVIYIIAACVSILGARYIGELDVMQAILLPYGAVSLALVTLLPFLIVFFFIHKSMSSGAARRTAWIFFAVLFVGLWITRGNDLGLDPNLRWIYNIAIGAVIASVIFDSKIHEYFGLAEARAARHAMIKQQLAEVEAALNRYAGIQNPSRNTQEVIRDLEERRDSLARKL